MCTRLQINGLLSDKININGGGGALRVKQGYRLSLSLYVIYIEAIMRAIYNSVNISGCILPGTSDRLKCLAYADDLLLCCKYSEINNTFHLFDDFYSASGSRLSVQKTSVLGATHVRNHITNNISCNFLSDESKFCDLFFSIDEFYQLSDRNWS